MKLYRMFGIVAIGLQLCLQVSCFAGSLASPSTPDPAPRATLEASESGSYLTPDFISAVIKLLQQEHVEKVPESKLVEAALDGMLRSLDAHGGYISPKTFQKMQESTKGSFGGLGIEVAMEHGFVKIITPVDQSPAHEAGLEAGDYITHIDKHLILGMTLDEAVEKMRGRLGSSVVLTIKREGRDFFDVTLKRSEIKYQPVRYDGHDHIGYVRIATFLNSQTSKSVREAVETLQKTGQPLQGLILDLRNNSGGLLAEAINVADLFLESVEVVSTRGQDPSKDKHFHAQPGDIAKNIPLVVLINAGSASAAEIVAGALQDHQRATILGTTSFGKGSVQSVLPLPQNLGALSITTARYYTPSGRCIQTVGIKPDVYVEQAVVEALSDKERKREKDMRLALKPDDFIQVLKGELKREALQGEAQGYTREKGYETQEKTLKNKNPSEDEKDQTLPRAFRDPEWPPLQKPKTLLRSQPNLKEDILLDYQLARAFDLLKGLAVIHKTAPLASALSPSKPQ